MGNSSHSNPVIVPFSVDTQGNFCSVALLFLKSMAKLKFKNMPGDKRLKDRAQSDWISKTCRNIQVQVIKTAAFNNRLALKDLIRRTSYHLLREDDLSTSFNISSVKIY